MEYLVHTREMLHLKHPVTVRSGRRCVHSRAFQEDERRFPELAGAKLSLNRLWNESSGSRGSTRGARCGVTSRPHNDRNADNHGADARHLRVAHAEVDPRIDAVDLHQKAGDAGEQQVFPRDLPGAAAASLPQDSSDDEGTDELVDGRGVDTL